MIDYGPPISYLAYSFPNYSKGMSELTISYEYVPVPDLFRSDVTGDLIPTCISCEKKLLQDGTQYLIEKAFKRIPRAGLVNTIFEYAICRDCAEQMHQKISVHSRKTMNDYFQSKVDLDQRREYLADSLDPDRWLDNCLITGKPIDECSEYQIFCQCDGADMMFSNLPYALSGEAIAGIQEIISPETKEELDRFSDDILGVPPELKELFEDRPLVMI